MTKIAHITATETRFPLASLYLSPLNPRQNVADSDVIDLATSIWDAGLIQSIGGLLNDDGRCEIVAGGRRLRALQYLAESHPDLATIRPELANPLVMLAPDRDTARVWATVENIARRDLHPAEEIRAYGKMSDAGSLPAAIASAFAVTEKHVYRRLALAKLPGPVLDALAANEISLSMAQCFTICDDETHALEVLDRCRGESWNDHRLKQELKPQSVKGTDRRALFVGEDAYKAAGGVLGGDLFAEVTLFDNPEILDELFTAKLAAEAEAMREAEGWKWVEAVPESHIAWNAISSRNCQRIRPVEGELSEEEAERFDELADLADSEALDDAGEAEFARLERIVEGDYAPEQRAVAGVIICVGQTGAISRSDAMVRPEDRAAAVTAGVLSVDRDEISAPAAPKSPISAKLADDLSRMMRGVRQHAALAQPDLLLALLAFHLSGQMGYRGAFGLRKEDVPNFPTTEEAGYAINPRLTTPAARPSDPWDSDLAKAFQAFRKKGAEHVMGELMSHLAALLTVDDKKLGALIDKEASTSVRENFTPTAANFWSRVPGSYRIKIWRELLGLKEDHPTATTFAKLKKVDQCAKLETLFTDKQTQAAYSLSEKQMTRIAQWLPEGMA